jgi:hypothetical protein
VLNPFTSKVTFSSLKLQQNFSTDVKRLKENGGNSMKLIIGDILKSLLDGEDYMIKKVVENMAMLESQNGKKQILTELDTLKLFYRKRQEISES